MFAPPCEKLRILRCAREFRFGAAMWGEILRGFDQASARCLSDKPWGTVWRISAELPDGPQDLVIKVFAVRSPRDRLRSFLKLSRLCRQWRGSAVLSRSGFPAARCRTLLAGERDGVRVDALVMDALPGRTLLDTLLADDLSVQAERELALKLGGLLNALWHGGLHSKDLKPSNLQIAGTPARPTVTILDTDTVGHRPAHPLLPLVLEPMGLGALPRRAAMFRLVRSWAWHAWLSGPDSFAPEPESAGRSRRMESRIARAAWRDLDRLVCAHGETTPAHNPITRRDPVSPATALG